MDTASRFASLPARPPTPPRESFVKRDRASSQSDVWQSVPSKKSIDTPNDSPNSITSFRAQASGRSNKRVEFLDASAGLDTLPEITNPANALPSRDRQPRKSILKSSSSLPSSDPLESDSGSNEPRDLPTMLADLVRELANGERSARLDAYVSLNGCLKAHKDLPSTQALNDKILPMTEFIRRDLTEAAAEGGNGDDIRIKQIAVEAVRLATILVMFHKLRTALPSSFQSFILNQAIVEIGRENASKALVGQHLFLLTLQDFPQKILTHEKLDRVLAALRSLDSRVKGRKIVAQKFAVYKRLMSQVRPFMLSRTASWMSQLFRAIISNARDVRSAALGVCVEAGLIYGREDVASKFIRDLFNARVTDQEPIQRYSDVLIERMNAWISSREDSKLVPQLWAAVILFLRCSPRQFEKWEHRRAWIKIIQRCFNSSDLELRFLSNRAWCRLIFSVYPDETTDRSMVILLRGPIIGQMERIDYSSSGSRHYKEAVFDVYRTLLYYAFRPGMSFGVLDRFWADYVVPMMPSKNLDKPVLDVATACGVLNALFGNKRQNIWISDRVVESRISVEDLPRIDPKWIRSRPASVLLVLQQLFEFDECWADTSQEDEPPLALQVWRCFTMAIGEAGSKEIIVSKDTMLVMADLVTYLIGLGKNDSSNSTISQSRLLAIFYALTLEAASNLGPLPFVEKRLIQDLNGMVVASDTPLGHTIKQRGGTVISAVAILLDHLMSIGDEGYDLQDRQRSISCVLSVATQSCSTTPSKIKLLTSLRPKPEVVPNNGSGLQVEIAVLDCLSDSFLTSTESQQMADVIPDALRLVAQRSPDIGEHIQTWARAVKLTLSKTLSTKLSAAQLEETIPYVCDILRYAKEDCTTITCPSKVVVPLMDVLYLLFCTQIVSDSRYEAWRCLSRGFSLWIEDSSCQMSTISAEGDRVFKKVVKTWQSLTDQVRQLKDSGSLLLRDFSTFLEAGLASKHKAILAISLSCWNDIFGEALDLQIPKHLTAQLVRLSRFADVLLPWSTDSQEAKTDIAPNDFANTPENIDEMDVKNAEKSWRDSLLSSAMSLKSVQSERRLRDGTDPPSSPLAKLGSAKKNAHQTTPTPRLRHDDSQVIFTAINSSPPSLSREDSQLLTERQKEVMERQVASGSGFYDGFSGVAPPSIEQVDAREPFLPSHNIKSRIETAEEAPSPVLPTENLAPFLGSSPTPSQPRVFTAEKINSDLMRLSPRSSSSAKRASSIWDLPSSPPDISAKTRDKPRDQKEPHRPKASRKKAEFKVSAALSSAEKQQTDQSKTTDASKEIGNVGMQERKSLASNGQEELNLPSTPNKGKSPIVSKLQEKDLSCLDNAIEKSCKQSSQLKALDSDVLSSVNGNALTEDELEQLPQPNTTSDSHNNGGPTTNGSKGFEDNDDDLVSSQIAREVMEIESQGRSKKQKKTKAAKKSLKSQEPDDSQISVESASGSRKRKRRSNPGPSQEQLSVEPLQEDVLECIVVVEDKVLSPEQKATKHANAGKAATPKLKRKRQHDNPDHVEATPETASKPKKVKKESSALSQTSGNSSILQPKTKIRRSSNRLSSSQENRPSIGYAEVDSDIDMSPIAVAVSYEDQEAAPTATVATSQRSTSRQPSVLVPKKLVTIDNGEKRPNSAPAIPMDNDQGGRSGAVAEGLEPARARSPGKAGEFNIVGNLERLVQEAKSRLVPAADRMAFFRGAMELMQLAMDGCRNGNGEAGG